MLRSGAFAAATLMFAASVRAQPALVPPTGTPMTMAEYQGLSCMAAGAATGVGALLYVDPITVAAGAMLSPLLLVPVAAAGFAVGCSVGATLSPALLWFYRASH